MKKHLIQAELLKESKELKQLRLTVSENLCDVYIIVNKNNDSIEDIQYDSITYSNVNWDTLNEGDDYELFI